MQETTNLFSAKASHRVWRGAYWNGALWAFGNGLVSSTLITYFAKDLGATPLHISWILAFPQLFGLFRLVAPWLLDWNPNRKRMAILCFLLSGVLLLEIPFLASRKMWGQDHLALLSLVLLWGGWHFFMYLALIPFYSWLGDAGESEQRLQRLGWRETTMLIATIAGTLTAAFIIDKLVPRGTPGNPVPKVAYVSAYNDCIVLGSLGVLLSVIPLLGMPHYERRTTNLCFATSEWKQLICDTRYWPLLAFNICFSFANGITVTAVAMYPYRILGISAVWLLYMQTYTRTMQAVTAPLASGWLNRAGHRWPMIFAQWLVSLGLVFYMFADSTRPLLLYGAWTCWIAYVVLNIGLPNLMLKLSPGESSPTYIALTMAISGVSFAIASLIGGWLLNTLSPLGATPHAYVPPLSTMIGGRANLPRDPFLWLFALGCGLRVLTSIWLLLLREPTPQLTAQNKSKC